MQNLLRLLLGLSLVGGSVFAAGQIGEVRVDVDKNKIPVRVSGSSPDVNSLAIQAFNMHGRYRVVASSFVLGLVLATVYDRSRSLWLSIVVHAANNCLAVILLYAALALQPYLRT